MADPSSDGATNPQLELTDDDFDMDEEDGQAISFRNLLAAIPRSANPTTESAIGINYLVGLHPQDQGNSQLRQNFYLDNSLVGKKKSDPNPEAVIHSCRGGAGGKKPKLDKHVDKDTGNRNNWIDDDDDGGGGGGSGDGDDDDDPYRNVSLADIGGLDANKEWLTNIILRPLQNPHQKLAFPPPKGILFYGPPGTGKTLLARAFGNDLSKALGKPVTFYHRKGADFLSKWFGESGNNIRKLFREAKAFKPAIIFLDELDGVCPSREGRHVGEGYTSVVTTLLGEMDTLTRGEVFVFGATNRLDAVDPAMRRPGRFDKHLEFLPPDFEARKKILQIGTRKWMDHSQPRGGFLTELGQATAGYTGADIDSLCRSVFNVAFIRHNPGADLDVGVEDLKITSQDWANALSQFTPSNSAVFGSSLYSPQPPSKKMLALIGSPLAHLYCKVERELDIISETSGKWASPEMDASVSAANLSIHTMLITDNGRSMNDESLENYIIPGILTKDKIGKFPIYRLGKEEIMNANLYQDKSMFVAKIIQQAGNCLNPCILYCPKIDDVVQDCAQVIPTMVEQFTQLRGKGVLLLATASVEADQINDFGLKRIFSKEGSCHSVRRPGDLERKTYFDIFSEILITVPPSAKGTNKKVQDRLDCLLKSAVDATKQRSLESMQSLHDKILFVCAANVRFEDKSDAFLEMQRLIGDYAGEG